MVAHWLDLTFLSFASWSMHYHRRHCHYPPPPPLDHDRQVECNSYVSHPTTRRMMVQQICFSSSFSYRRQRHRRCCRCRSPQQHWYCHSLHWTRDRPPSPKFPCCGCCTTTATTPAPSVGRQSPPQCVRIVCQRIATEDSHSHRHYHCHLLHCNPLPPSSLR